jgi:hypothetical protein
MEMFFSGALNGLIDATKELMSPTKYTIDIHHTIFLPAEMNQRDWVLY